MLQNMYSNPSRCLLAFQAQLDQTKTVRFLTWWFRKSDFNAFCYGFVPSWMLWLMWHCPWPWDPPTADSTAKVKAVSASPTFHYGPWGIYFCTLQLVWKSCLTSNSCWKCLVYNVVIVCLWLEFHRVQCCTFDFSTCTCFFSHCICGWIKTIWQVSFLEMAT